MILCGGGGYIESLLLGETFKVIVPVFGGKGWRWMEEAVMVVVED